MQLLDGKVLAYPTEAVWRLGCDPGNEAATMRLLAIKRRPVEKGLILVASSVSEVEPLLAGLLAGQWFPPPPTAVIKFLQEALCKSSNT